MAVKVSWRGDQFLKEMDQSSAKAMKKAVKNAADKVRALAPKRTGQLTSSIRVQGIPKGQRISVDAPYASYVEFGTGRTPAQPFLSPVLDNPDPILEDYAKEMTSELRRSGGKG